MTEADWNSCTEPQQMLEFLRGKVSDRKLRLFAVACCRSVWSLLDSYSTRAVRIIERHADKETYFWEMWAVWGIAREAPKYAYWKTGNADHWSVRIGHAITDLTQAKQRQSLFASAISLSNLCTEQPHTDLATLIRCVFGIPLVTSVDPPWVTPTITRLAKTIYAERAFGTMPILADALEEASCDDAEVLRHCRGPGPHARGCWVVDIVLDRK